MFSHFIRMKIVFLPKRKNETDQVISIRNLYKSIEYCKAFTLVFIDSSIDKGTQNKLKIPNYKFDLLHVNKVDRMVVFGSVRFYEQNIHHDLPRPPQFAMSTARDVIVTV